MANRPSNVSIACYLPSADGRWYTQYPYGNAIQQQAFLNANLSGIVNVSGSMLTKLQLAASLSAPVSDTASFSAPPAALAAAMHEYNTVLASLTTNPGAYYDGDISVTANGRWVNGAGLDLSSTLQGANFQGLETSAAQGLPDWYGQDMTPVMALYATWAPNCLRLPLNAASFVCATTTPGLMCRNINKGGTSWNGPARSPDPNGTYLASVDKMLALAVYYKCYVWISGHWSAPTFQFTGDTAPVQAMPLGQPPFIDSLMYQMFIAFAARYCAPSAPPITVPLNINTTQKTLLSQPNLTGALTIGKSDGSVPNATVWNAGSSKNNGQGNAPNDGTFRAVAYMKPGYASPLAFSTTPWNLGSVTGFTGYNAQTNQVQITNANNTTPTAFAWSGDTMAFWIDSDDASGQSSTNVVRVNIFSEWDPATLPKPWANNGGPLTMGAQFQWTTVIGGPYNKMSLQFWDPVANVYLGIAVKVMEPGGTGAIGFLVSGTAAGPVPIYQLSLPVGHDGVATVDSRYTGNTYTPSQFITTVQGVTATGATTSFAPQSVSITPQQFAAWITWANAAALAAGGAPQYPQISTDITTYQITEFHTNNEISSTNPNQKDKLGHMMKGFALTQSSGGTVNVTLDKNAIVLEVMNEPFLDTMNGYGEPPNAACKTAMAGTPGPNGTYVPTTVSYWYCAAYNYTAAQNVPNQLVAAITVNQSWQAYGYNQLGQALRAMGVQNIVQCNGPGYANAPSTFASWLFKDSLAIPQVAVGQHTYADTVYAYGEQYPNVSPDTYSGTVPGPNWHVPGTDAVIAAGIALAYTEDGGYTGPQCTQTPAEPHTNYVITYAKSRGIPYFGWTFWSPGGAANNTNFLLQNLSPGTPTQGQGAVTFAAFTNTAVTAVPQISPPQSGNTYTAPIPVVITDVTAGAYIAYTLDGSPPIVGTSPSGPAPLSITVNPPTTGNTVPVTARGFVPTGGYQQSGTTQVTYQFGSAPGLAITTQTPLPTQTQGVQVNPSLTQSASGGQPPYTWGTTPTGFPTGLSEDNTGKITGTPSGATTYSWNQTVVDSSTPQQNANANQSMVVVSQGGLLPAPADCYITYTGDTKWDANGNWNTANNTSSQTTMCTAVSGASGYICQRQGPFAPTYEIGSLPSVDPNGWTTVYQGTGRTFTDTNATACIGLNPQNGGTGDTQAAYGPSSSGLIYPGNVYLYRWSAVNASGQYGNWSPTQSIFMYLGTPDGNIYGGGANQYYLFNGSQNYSNNMTFNQADTSGVPSGGSNPNAVADLLLTQTGNIAYLAVPAQGPFVLGDVKVDAMAIANGTTPYVNFDVKFPTAGSTLAWNGMFERTYLSGGDAQIGSTFNPCQAKYLVAGPGVGTANAWSSYSVPWTDWNNASTNPTGKPQLQWYKIEWSANNGASGVHFWLGNVRVSPRQGPT